jgi:hypothetical protein
VRPFILNPKGMNAFCARQLNSGSARPAVDSRAQAWRWWLHIPAAASLHRW